MIPQFFLIAFGTLVSEDLTCIATGVLVAQHRLGLLEGTLACLMGIFAGDMLLFLLGRAAGSAHVLGRWIPEEKLAAASAWIEKRGINVVLVSRFTPGLRLPTYLAAGLLRSRFWAFAGYFLLASALWTPLLVGGTAVFGRQFAPQSPVAAVALVSVLLAAGKLRKFESRRRFVGFLKRTVQWEFWPMWVAYLPLVSYLLFLAMKHRSLTLFTAANPGIPSGGLVGESKSQILGHLSQVAEFTLVPAGAHFRVSEFPVVLKPDVGERGSRVAIVRTQEEVGTYLRSARCDTIVQRYVPGCEFGVYYVRDPREAEGRVLYITEKRFPAVIGNGRTSLRNLILRDPRAVAMASAYVRVAKRPLDSIPAEGERVQLVEIGSHCRGTIFLDGSRWITPALNSAIDRVSQGHPEFYLGRYDVRAESVEALQRGEFRVIELNGVSAEATHVYDPGVCLREAYRVMRLHWRTAFEIGATNRARGFAPMTLGDLLRLVLPSSKPPFPRNSVLTHVA